MRLAFFQPDIPQNLGAALRLAACLATPLDIIEPCAFPLSDRALARAALDYAQHSTVERHDDFASFRAARPAPARLILLTTSGETFLPAFRFTPEDILILGSESAGVSAEVHHAAAVRLRIPLAPGLRSLYVVTAAALTLGEALRQTGLWPQY